MIEKKNNSIMLRVHPTFHERVMRFIKKFYEENGIKISSTEATMKIDQKIEEAGGLVV